MKVLKKQLSISFHKLNLFLSNTALLEDSLFRSYKTIYNLKPDDIDFKKVDDKNNIAHSYFLSLQKMRDEYIFSRYSNFAPYKLLLKNNIDKALAKYEKLDKKGKLFDYEKSLINHINNSVNHEFHAFDPSCDTCASDKLISPVCGLKAFLVCFIVSSIFFCGFCAIYNIIASINTLVLLSAPWYTGFLCSGLCSIFGAIALLVYMPNKHLTKTERKNFSKILITKIEKKFIFTIFTLSIAVSMFFAVMIMTSNVRFYENNITFDNQAYNYDQIDSVYYIDARYNTSGNRIERASYVILFNDNTSLDLDGFTSIEFTEKEVLPLLKSKGFDLKFADSERDLPWY